MGFAPLVVVVVVNESPPIPGSGLVAVVMAATFAPPMHAETPTMGALGNRECTNCCRTTLIASLIRSSRSDGGNKSVLRYCHSPLSLRLSLASFVCMWLSPPPIYFFFLTEKSALLVVLRLTLMKSPQPMIVFNPFLCRIFQFHVIFS